MMAAVPESPHLVTDLKTLCLATMATEWRPLHVHHRRWPSRPAPSRARE